MQVAGLQIVVDDKAIAQALPLAPGSRMALPLLVHAPQVRSVHPLSLHHGCVIGPTLCMVSLRVRYNAFSVGLVS